MFGKNTDTYREWKKEKARYSKIPQMLDVINLGSSCDANNFDYSLWEIAGFNLASCPQDIYYDNQLLLQYGKNVKKGGIVFISLSEFALITDKYEIEDHNYKYYWYLDKNRIDNYRDWKKIILLLCPGLLDKRLIKQEIKHFINVICKGRICELTQLDMQQQSEKMLHNWFAEFGWTYNCELKKEQEESINKSWNLIKKDLEYCEKNNIKPIIIIPPFCSYLKELLPQNIIEKCLWEYINRLNKRGIQIISFWEDEELSKPEYYDTPIKLNDKGKRLFNEMLQLSIYEKKGKNKKKDKFENDMQSDMENEYQYTLNNGIKIQWVSFGTGVVKRFYRNKKLYIKDTIKSILKTIKNRKIDRRLKNDIAIKSILNAAILSGYRVFDTGRLYGHSELSLGRVISDYNREEFFIVTKVSSDDLKRYTGKNTVSDNLSISLNFLKTNYVDSYLLHFPTDDYVSMYKEIEKEYINGRAKTIGVCNFDVDELKVLIHNTEIKPMICQVELHPLNIKRELRSFCEKNGIVIMAHTPTAHMDKRIVESDIFIKLQSKYKKSIAQIIYRWHYQNHIIPIISTISIDHMKDNLNIFDFELSDIEMKKIEELDQGISLDKNENKTNDCPAFIYNL